MEVGSKKEKLKGLFCSLCYTKFLTNQRGEDAVFYNICEITQIKNVTEIVYPLVNIFIFWPNIKLKYPFSTLQNIPLQINFKKCSIQKEQGKKPHLQR